MNPYPNTRTFHLAYVLPMEVVHRISDALDDMGADRQGHRDALIGATAVLCEDVAPSRYALPNGRANTTEELAGVVIALAHLGWSARKIRLLLHLPEQLAQRLPLPR